MKKFKFIWLAVLSIGLVFVLSSCSDTGSNSRSTAQRQTNVSGSDLEKQIKDRFNADPQLSVADLSVSADVDENRVSISGKVNSEAERSKAVEIAKSVEPRMIVEDKIDVAPHELARTDFDDQKAKAEREQAKQRGDKIGDSTEDAFIHAEIISKLTGSSDTAVSNPKEVNVDVEKGVVTLRGKVRNGTEKANAQRVAQDVDGVKQVNNELELEQSQNR